MGVLVLGLRGDPRDDTATGYDATSRGRLPRHAPGHVRRAYEREEIEARSLARIRRRHHEPHPYWATTEEAAVVPGVSRSNVSLMSCPTG